eukprot:530025-Pleurochrysis_carterae.AAC.1
MNGLIVRQVHLHFSSAHPWLLRLGADQLKVRVRSRNILKHLPEKMQAGLWLCAIEHRKHGSHASAPGFFGCTLPASPPSAGQRIDLYAWEASQQQPPLVRGKPFPSGLATDEQWVKQARAATRPKSLPSSGRVFHALSGSLRLLFQAL